jgi:hypothetical protein
MEMIKCNTATSSLNNWYRGPVSTRMKNDVVNDLLFFYYKWYVKSIAIASTNTLNEFANETYDTLQQ